MAVAQTPIRDGNEYRKRVLAPAAASNQIPDLFTRYGLSVEEADPVVITRQLKATLAIWNKETSHPKYGTLVRRLIKEHPQAARVLSNTVLRERERQEVCRTTEADDAKRYQPLEAQLTELVKRHGGLPRSHAADLIQFGAGSGLSEDEVRVRLEQERLIDDIGATRPMLAPAKFAEIQRRLAEHQTATGRTLEHAHLFSFIGARFDAAVHELRSRYEQCVSENDKRAFGDEKTLVSRVLVDIRLHLLGTDPEPYRNSVMREVKDRLLPAIESHKLIDGNITQEALAELEQTAVGSGLDAGRAAAAVRELARERRVTIVAPAPGHPEPVPPPPGPVPAPSADTERRGPPRPSDLLPPRPPPQPDPSPDQSSSQWPPGRDDLRPPIRQGSGQHTASHAQQFWRAAWDALNDPIKFVRSLLGQDEAGTDTSTRRHELPPPIQQTHHEERDWNTQPAPKVASVVLTNPAKYLFLGLRGNVTPQDLSIAAGAWFAYAFIPLIGPGVAWLMAGLLTRSRRMFAWSGFYLGFPLLFIPSADSVLGGFILLWLVGMVHIPCVRKRVSSEIRSHARPSS